ncbi:MAG: bifunctional hydroxymethylpyrimidine kinase/phosphomethylpyrimidine kinase [Planctomycetes bacterium]|nr:bifunctional hydroxymethylpyrimidine kinase/phosphomethylpyrimidine kinase [Planctomycetota bacterium]
MTPRLLLLAGVDPSGGAGLTVDAVTAARHGCQPLPVVTALTVQNRHAFTAREAPPAATFAAACAAALADGPVHAVKVGLLGDAAFVAAVAAAVRPLVGTVPIVVDPVLVATAAGPAASAELAAAYRSHLLPLATLLLPNTLELPALGDVAASAAVLRKGGHGNGATSADVLVRRGAADVVFARPRLPVGPVRGTGCALATAIAALLAHGLDLETACRRAGDWLHGLLARLGSAPASGLPRLLPLLDGPPPWP